jgi:AT-binding transcription factor 1
MYQQQPGVVQGLLSPVLSSSAAAAMALATRNSCKALKCPKCSWHYKYQETLEIHMKEKHPESETSCLPTSRR